MFRWYSIRKFVRHRWLSRRWDAFHSPFLYELFTFCCTRTDQDRDFGAIEKMRATWKKNPDVIQQTDFGAGSYARQRTKTVAISRIARRSLSLPFQCRFMARLAQFTNVCSVLEFGTSLGIMAAYLGKGAPEADITTIEGDPAIAALAVKTFEILRLKNIHAIHATFESYLDDHSAQPVTYDLIFLDGNHKSSALVHYYHKLKRNCTENTLMVIDDIYWSPDMHTGWQQLIRQPEVTQSVDCFHFGILFFTPDFLQKENHCINLPLQV